MCFLTNNLLPLSYEFKLFYLCLIYALQKLKRRQSALETVAWSPEKKRKMTAVLTLDYTSEEEVDVDHPQRQRTVIPMSWESQELGLLKRQLDAHELTKARATGRGVRQPVVRGQADRLSTIKRPEDAPAWALA